MVIITVDQIVVVFIFHVSFRNHKEKKTTTESCISSWVYREEEEKLLERRRKKEINIKVSYVLRIFRGGRRKKGFLGGRGGTRPDGQTARELV